MMFHSTKYILCCFILQKREMTGGVSEQRVTQNALNLQEVLFVMGGPSLDDSDDEDEDEDEDTERRLHPRNCCFYNPKLGKRINSIRENWRNMERLRSDVHTTSQI